MSASLFQSPDYALVWPAELFESELLALLDADSGRTGLVRPLLVEAFVSPVVVDRFDRLPPAPRTPTGRRTAGETRRHFVSSLLQASVAGQLQPRQDPARRWSDRSIDSPIREPDMVGARRGFQRLITDLDDAGYFDLHAPRTEGLDSAEEAELQTNGLKPHRQLDFSLNTAVAEQWGREMDLTFLARDNDIRSVGFNGTTSFSHTGELPSNVISIADMSADEFFDLVEVFHDLVARPRSRTGGTFGDFAIEPGQRLYRWRINQLLTRHRVPVEMAERGELTGRLIITTDDARNDLLVSATDAGDHAGDVEHAIVLFRKRDATVAEKRSAIVALARILEHHRDLLEHELLTKDEAALFQIANQFDLRHNKANQRSDYDPAFLDWIFWWYLSTVELIHQLLVRPTGGQSSSLKRPERSR